MAGRHGAGLYRRVVIKLSGEALTGPDSFGLHAPTLARIAADCKRAIEVGGGQLAVVVGGGNFFRGMQGAEKGIERARADSIGMAPGSIVVAPGSTNAAGTEARERGQARWRRTCSA